MIPASLPASIVFLFSLLLPFSLAAQSPQEDDGVLDFAPRLRVAAETEVVQDPISGYSEPVPGIVFHQSAYISRRPLLPVIFFDEPGSAILPSRYQQFSSSFDAEAYTDEKWTAGSATPAKYREILNIIGYRMRDNPEATIELQGGYSAESGETEQVALRRAEVVQEYLTTIWSIEPERIAIDAARQSCDPSAPGTAQEEGRCVRMRSDTREILASMRVRTTEPREQDFRIQIDLDPMMDAGKVASVEIDVFFADSILSTTIIAGSPDSALYRLVGEWTVPDGYFCRPSMLVDDIFVLPPLQVRATIHTIDGVRHNSNVVPVEVKSGRYGQTADNSLSLPFFGYRQTDLSDVQRAWLDEMLERDRSQGGHYQIVPNPDPSERFDVETQLLERERLQAELADRRKVGIVVRFENDEEQEEEKHPQYQSQFLMKDSLNDSIAYARAMKAVEYIEKDLAAHGDGRSTVKPGTTISNGQFRYYDTPEERLYARTAIIYRFDLDRLPGSKRGSSQRGDR